MGQTTEISWTDMVWNPVRGCTRVSPGCERCYAETMAARFPWGAEVTSNGRWNGKIQLLPEKLGEPLKWRKPCRVFVNSVSDLFHPGVPFDFVLRVFTTMEQAKRHTFQVLTKRPERMVEFCRTYGIGSGNQWPTNVWAGVTVEDQARALERIPALLQVPSAVHFLSCEPLLGPLNLDPGFCDVHGANGEEYDFKGGEDGMLYCPECAADGYHGEASFGGWLDPLNGGINWVICGGESGPKARPFDLDWARNIRDQCRDAGVAFYFKQAGRHAYERRPAVGAEPGTSAALARLGTEHPQRGWFKDWTLVHHGEESEWVRYMRHNDANGRDPGEWPADLRVQELPEVTP